MTDLGECKKYLNVRITRAKSITQTEYVEFIVDKYADYLLNTSATERLRRNLYPAIMSTSGYHRRRICQRRRSR
jgi:predicted DNA-binding protein